MCRMQTPETKAVLGWVRSPHLQEVRINGEWLRMREIPTG